MTGPPSTPVEGPVDDEALTAQLAGADLREQIARFLGGSYPHSREVADALLAGPLRSLVEQAAEAARLRETVARVEALHAHLAKIGFTGGVEANLRCALDGEADR